ncbi:hypothetical protein NA57DRAFT_50857 [Rhizodiscina lignyota]|uniref:DUF4211 domain-containing protein n=1 Tax=Rhizodiscina lignyota TaxID=1504668 RepID=A0A9P4MB60_9PEZI|nr:hypothetical protein NA57DRAFT_50857 [Rhizodiscina lignyota]
MPSKRRTRQTRLTFDPLSSSSPAKSQYSSAVRDRLSGVGYEDSPSKRMKVGEKENEIYENIDVLPTPAKSSQAQIARGPSRTQPSASSSRSRHNRAKQGRLDFSSHIGYKVPEDESVSVEDMPSTRAQRHTMRNPFRGKNNPAPLSDTSSSDTAEEQPRSRPSRTQRHLRSRGDKQSDEGQEVQEQDDEELPMRRTKRTTKSAVIELSSDGEDDNADDDFDSVLCSDSGKAIGTTAAFEEIGEPETSGDEIMHSSPTKKLKRASAHKAQTHRGAYTSRVERDDFVVDDDDDEVEVVSQRRSSKKKTPKKVVKKPTRRVHKDDILEDDGFVIDDEEEEEDDDEPPSRHHRERQHLSESEDESEEDIPSPSKRRRLSQHKTPDQRKSRQEEEDLAEDLEFLGGSGGKPKPTPSRLRSTPKHDPRKAALEEFKRRRAGVEAESSSALQPTQRKRRALYDTESEEDPDGQDVQEAEDGSEVDEVEDGADEADAGHMFREDDDDEGFVVEDEDEPIGVPTDLALPLQFSHLSRAKGKDLFKYAIEWMVQKKINPAFAITDEVYDLAFRKLNDEAKGLAGSKFVSAAWKLEFTRSLNSRPEIVIHHTGADGINHCEACGRRGHPATYEITFHGNPYNRETLEDVENEDDSDADDDEERETYDHIGNVIPPPSTVYHVGQFCMRNAQTGHTLHHWKFHLYEWVVKYLQGSGHLTPEKIVERDSWNTKKRRQYANGVTDEMEQIGEIKSLYQNFRSEIEVAREARGSGYAFDDDD